MKEQKGITLIALIITIIVMLILVGVSVTVALNGGLFTTAKQATDKTAVELDKEQLLELALGAIQDNGQVDLDKLDIAVSADGKFEGTNGTYTSKKTGNKYKVNGIGSVEVAPSTKGFDDITAANYGDTIEYSAGNVSDWKVFYKDSNYLYIMTSEYLLTANLPDEIKAIIESGPKYSVSWDNHQFISSDAKTDISEEVATKYQLSWWSKITANEIAENSRAVADLLNVSVWTEKFGNTSKGIEAIGAPTIEMWVNSWNQKGELEGIQKYPEIFVECDQDTYYVSTSANPMASETTKATLNNNDKLYFPDYTDEEEYYDTYGYWLASPLTHGGEFMCLVQDNYIGQGWAYPEDTWHAARPVVAIPSNLVTTNADGEWAVK